MQEVWIRCRVSKWNRPDEIKKSRKKSKIASTSGQDKHSSILTLTGWCKLDDHGASSLPAMQSEIQLLLPQLLNQITLFKWVSPSVISPVYLGLWVMEDFILMKFFHWEMLSCFMATSVLKYNNSNNNNNNDISCAWRTRLFLN